ncbi:MAG: hypothetical protein ACTHXB_07355 [Luteimonas sp.]
MRNVYARYQALLLAAALGLAGAAAAQDPPPPADEPTAQDAVENGDVEADEEQAAAEPEDLSATGDAWVDAQLVDIARYGRRHREAFIDELVRYREAPRALVVALLDEQGWEPGEVYFACSLAGVTGRSCRSIAERRGQPPEASWSALASGLGADAGSEAFGRIKRGIVYSYRRWARPLELDAELEAAFRDDDEG